MNSHNCFITLTYSDAHLASERFVYEDWQEFIKRLRAKREYDEIKHTNTQRKKLNKGPLTSEEIKELRRRAWYIPYMVTGEYGEKNKRPHWHAILFNYQPHNLKYHSTTELGDRIHTSETIEALWGKNDPDQAPTRS